MSDHVARPSHDEEATSSTSSRTHQSSWMSHWMNRSSKPVTMVNSSLSISDKDGHVVGRKSCLEQGGLMVEHGVPQSGKAASRDSEETVTRTMNETKRTMGFQNKHSNSSLPTLSLWPTTENTFTPRTRIDHELGHKNKSLTLAVDKEDTVRQFDLLRENNSSNIEKHGLCLDHSKHANGSGSGAAFKRKFPNDNFICFDQGHSKYQKFSTFLFHEKMNNNLSHESRQVDGLRMQDNPSMNKNFLPFTRNKQSENITGHSNPRIFPSRRTSDIEQGKLSVHNVETMRICTMVDSVQNSPGGPPKISQRAHHFLFTKETCVNLSKEHQLFREPNSSKEKMFGGSFSLSPDVGSSRPQGVKIQPLWSSTDSEDKENTGNPLTSKADSRNESSAETDAMPTTSFKSQHIVSGMASFPSNKDDAVDKYIPPAAFSSRTERSRSKRPITEIPDMNVQLPGLQPAVSSTDSMEPSTSRVHSLDAKHLFSCREQTSRPDFNVRQDLPLGAETSNRWIKRLKLSSADSVGVGTKSPEMGEASSNEKFGNFFNRIVKCNQATVEPTLTQHHDKEHMACDQDNPTFPMGSKKGNQSMMGGGCTWIQRWRQRPTAQMLRNPEPVVICEPHSLKLGPDELGKKQFPSIAAMALMGKTMNGFRACELSKRGPVVVWNTKEY